MSLYDIWQKFVEFWNWFIHVDLLQIGLYILILFILWIFTHAFNKHLLDSFQKGSRQVPKEKVNRAINYIAIGSLAALLILFAFDSFGNGYIFLLPTITLIYMLMLKLSSRFNQQGKQ